VTPPVTLISGASRGIGRFLVEHSLAAGHRVIGLSRKAVDWTHGRYEHHEVDVTDEKSIVEVMRIVRRRHGGVDHLINNAGIASMNHSLLTPVSVVTRILATNVTGTFLLSRECARLMQPKKYGRIVNVASVATPLKLEGEAAYAASKAAVVSLTEILAREYAPMGITVNAVGPGPVETDLIRGISAEAKERLLRRLAIPRYSTVQDVANVVDFFLSPQSGMVTGQIVYLGGV